MDDDGGAIDHIAMAQGVLMARYNIDMPAAYDLLRATAQVERMLPVELAYMLCHDDTQDAALRLTAERR